MTAQKWRLSRTLSRRVEFRPIEDEDMKFLAAAYKKGDLKSLGPTFASTEMEYEAFREAFIREVMTNYHGAWTLFAQTRKGFMPVGAVLGFYPHPNKAVTPFMIVGDILWFWWASPRNRVEAAVKFFSAIRDQTPMMEFASEAHMPFFEMLAKHGVMRRVGTSFNVYPAGKTALFETRQREWH